MTHSRRGFFGRLGAALAAPFVARLPEVELDDDPEAQTLIEVARKELECEPKFKNVVWAKARDLGVEIVEDDRGRCWEVYVTEYRWLERGNSIVRERRIETEKHEAMFSGNVTRYRIDNEVAHVGREVFDFCWRERTKRSLGLLQADNELLADIPWKAV